MSKKFTDREKAIEFFDDGNYNKPNSMKIDSIPIKIYSIKKPPQQVKGSKLTNQHE